MLRNTVEKLLDEAFETRKDLFLISLDISGDNHIKVVIDGDDGVLVEDCIFISRAIEHNLDREAEDFSLEVFSAGATAPLEYPRQYAKHKGRYLDIKTSDGKSIEGKLTDVHEDAVVLIWKAREPKSVGKGKVTVTKEETVPFKDIKEAKVIIKF